MSIPHRQRKPTYQPSSRGETPDNNTYTTSSWPQPGYLSPLAPPMTYSSSTDSNLSISTSYSSASTLYNNMQPCHSPKSSHEYDSTYDYEPRSSTQGRSESFSTSSNHGYVFDSQTMAALPSSPKSTAAERSTQRFICLYKNCEGSFSRVADLSRHQKSIHFPTKTDCPKSGCNRKGFYGFTREDHLIEHLRQYHREQLAKRTSNRSRRDDANS
ncbi:hypothetical protein MGYG_05727 [Nannizzia gypsea CBS 118893]|uniref:C2H2-type domain-containing protein n=1 Tax=Arthroderma gypseum (strain ATCC MYA-4604 / CBS 118893) TaxID=535722 RepID=E4UXJ4_ARTGP|nr:hypothetical protein MGYG_05727 [Nannizzia gypsea CBS 118893]EFR02728.1 hypothetical protein MGYG_05727 [Nannizzia gypsea CBS 118893]